MARPIDLIRQEKRNLEAERLALLAQMRPLQIRLQAIEQGFVSLNLEESDARAALAARVDDS